MKFQKFLRMSDESTQLPILPPGSSAPNGAGFVSTDWSLVLEAGADANMKDARGMTPLFLAVSKESFETVVKLLEKKVLCASRAPFPWRCCGCACTETGHCAGRCQH